MQTNFFYRHSFLCNHITINLTILLQISHFSTTWLFNRPNWGLVCVSHYPILVQGAYIIKAEVAKYGLQTIIVVFEFLTLNIHSTVFTCSAWHSSHIVDKLIWLNVNVTVLVLRHATLLKYATFKQFFLKSSQSAYSPICCSFKPYLYKGNKYYTMPTFQPQFAKIFLQQKTDCLGR